MIVLRGIGWLLVVLALLFLGRDLVLWHQSGHWAPLLAGKLWHDVSPDTLGLAQAGIERHVWKPLWNPGIFTLLLQPCWLVLGVPGILLAVLSRRGRKRRRFAR